MDWTFEEFRAELDTLNPSVRKKAIEIAKELIEKEDFSKEKAIKKAIVMAEVDAPVKLSHVRRMKVSNVNELLKIDSFVG